MKAADLGALKVALAATLGEVLGTDEFDVVEDESGALEAMADEWSLRIEGWPGGIAFVTIEDEPSEADVTQLREARRRVMDAALERALAAVDVEAGGGLTAALRASGDPLSVDLALAIAVHQSPV